MLIGIVFPRFYSKWCRINKLRFRIQSLLAFMFIKFNYRYPDVSLHIWMDFSKYVSSIRMGLRLSGWVKSFLWVTSRWPLGISRWFYHIQMSPVPIVSSIQMLWVVSECIYYSLWVIFGCLGPYPDEPIVFFECYPDAFSMYSDRSSISWCLLQYPDASLKCFEFHIRISLL